MKYVIRYMLDGDGTVPKFVEDGGYFPSGEELIGVSIDDDKRYLPSTVQKLTKQQLVDSIQVPVNSNKTQLQIAEEWLASVGLNSYE